MSGFSFSSSDDDLLGVGGKMWNLDVRRLGGLSHGGLGGSGPWANGRDLGTARRKPLLVGGRDRGWDGRMVRRK